MPNKFKGMEALIEFIASTGLALFFHVVLHYEQLAYGVFAGGLLLSLATLQLHSEIGKTREHLETRYQMAHELTFALAAVEDFECQIKARDLCAQTMRTIRLLQQGSIPLDESEYYLEGAKCSDHARLHINSVDPVSVDWEKRDVLGNLLQANLHAHERGVGITRIFIASRGELSHPEAKQVLMKQIKQGVDVRVAWREDLPVSVVASSGDIESSMNFAIYDDQVVLDVFVRPGKYYGFKTARQEKVKSYLNLFELINHSAHTATEKDGELFV
jgi:hypothetical protein